MNIASIANILLKRVVGGAVEPAAGTFPAKSLWQDETAVLFFVTHLASRFQSGEFSGAKLVSVIKEVAPVGKVKTDEELGVGEFQSKYFLDNPVYLDEKREFFTALGGKSLMWQSWSSWNPLTAYRDLQDVLRRAKNKGADGNLAGEGFLKGGLILVANRKTAEGEAEVVYVHQEVTGRELPFEEIRAALATLPRRPVPSPQSSSPRSGGGGTPRKVETPQEQQQQGEESECRK